MLSNMSDIVITKHFYDRFRKRQARSKRVREFARKAYLFGRPVEDLAKLLYFEDLCEKELYAGSYAKIYKGFVYWFRDNRAITLYALPTYLRGKV